MPPTVEPESILQILLVRAVEETDSRGEMVTWSEREQATRRAATVTGEPEALPENAPLDPTIWRLLAIRAALLHDHALGVIGTPPAMLATKWPGIGLCTSTFLLGWSAHNAGLSHSFGLLPLPLLLALLWNAGVYGMLISEHFRTPGLAAKRRLSSAIPDWLQRRLAIQHPSNKPAAAYTRMVSTWVRSWYKHGVVSWFHAASICFTLGVLAAICLRGLHTGYATNWNCSWFGTRGMSILLGTLLAPASYITGISLPDSRQSWELLRQTAIRGGVPAGPWIHLYAVTLCGWVILPRLFLCLASATTAARERSTPPPWPRTDPYLRRILALARQGGNIEIALLPFGFKRPATIAAGTSHDAVERLIREVWGQNARVSWMPCAAYGDEDFAWDDIWARAPGCGGALLLYDVHATPENEVHGSLLDAVWSRFANGPGGLLVALECADFDARRLQSRIMAWAELTQQRGFSVLPLQDGATLDPSFEPPGFLRRME